MAKRTVVLSATVSKARGTTAMVELKVREWAIEGAGPVLLGWTVDRGSPAPLVDLVTLIAGKAKQDAQDLAGCVAKLRRKR